MSQKKIGDLKIHADKHLKDFGAGENGMLGRRFIIFSHI